MPDEHGGGQLQRVQNFQHILSAPRVGIAGFGLARDAVAAPGDAVNVAAVRELRGQVVVDVRAMAGASEQDHGATGATPIEHFQVGRLLPRLRTVLGAEKQSSHASWPWPAARAHAVRPTNNVRAVAERTAAARHCALTCSPPSRQTPVERRSLCASERLRLVGPTPVSGTSQHCARPSRLFDAVVGRRPSATRGVPSRRASGSFCGHVRSVTALHTSTSRVRVSPSRSRSLSRSYRLWRLSQNCSEVPKKRPSRSAVSAVTARTP